MTKCACIEMCFYSRHETPNSLETKVLSESHYAVPVSSSDKDIADPVSKNTVEPIYDDIAPVQRSNNVAATHVKMQNNPAYDTSVL